MRIVATCARVALPVGARVSDIEIYDGKTGKPIEVKKLTKARK